MKQYSDYELATLVFGPKGIEQYLKDKKRFQTRFGMKYTRENMIDIIAKLIPEVERKNKDRKVMQPFATHYRLIEKGERKKDIESHADALGKTLELIYVFAINERFKIEGLKDHIEKQGFADLVENADQVYRDRLEEIKRVVNMHDVVRDMKEGLEGIRDEVHESKEAILNAILASKKEEKKEAQDELNQTIKEILQLIDNTPEKDQKELVKKIYNYLQSMIK